jgi:hypothetical protein
MSSKSRRRCTGESPLTGRVAPVNLGGEAMERIGDLSDVIVGPGREG